MLTKHVCKVLWAGSRARRRISIVTQTKVLFYLSRTFYVGYTYTEVILVSYMLRGHIDFYFFNRAPYVLMSLGRRMGIVCMSLCVQLSRAVEKRST